MITTAGTITGTRAAWNALLTDQKHASQASASEAFYEKQTKTRCA